MGFKLKHLFKGVGKALKPINKIATPVFGAALGTMLGGPAGGILGGALAGSTTRGGHNKFAGALQGAGVGAAYGALAPTLASSFGAAPGESLLSRMTGLNAPSFLNQVGMESAPGIGGGLGLIGNLGQPGIFPQLTMGNVARSAFGALGHTQHPQPYMEPPEPLPAFQGFPEIGFDEGMNAPQGRLGFQPMSLPMGHGFNASNPHPHAYLSPLDILRKLSPNIPFGKSMQPQVPKSDKPLKEEKRREKKGRNRVFAKGGLVKKERVGFIRESDSGGQDDDIDMNIAPNAYVMNATDLSLFGDGNTENGKKKVKDWEDALHKKHANFLKSGIVNLREYVGQKEPPVKAKVSNGEYVLKPSTLLIVGKGDNAKGAKAIDKMRHKLRKQKGVKEILPPRTKPMKYYLQGNR